MKRRLLTFVSCSILLLPAAAWAQPRGGDGPDRVDPRTARLAPVIRFLELDEEQVQALLALQVERGQQLQPLARAFQENARAMQQALGSDSPDPTLVGQLTLDARRIRVEMQELFQQQREGVQSALNLSPEQVDKLEVLQTSLRVFPIAGIAAGLNLIEGPTALGAVFGGIITDVPGFVPQPPPGLVGDGDRRDEGMMSRDMARERAEEFLMRFTGLETEVNRIGDNVDRVSLRVGVIPIRRDSE